METTTNRRSCRLAPYGDSGRIRWCIGEERQWKLKLKILVFVPILLLIATAIALLILNLAHPKRNYDVEITKHTQSQFHDNEFINEDDKDVLYEIGTSYIPVHTFSTQSFLQLLHNRRRTRELHIATQHFINDNDTEYTYPEEPKNYRYTPTKIIAWKIPQQDNTKYRNSQNRPNSQEIDERLLGDDENDYIEQLEPWDENTKTSAQIRKAQAAVMKQYMNTAINPCDDFYEHACGNWVKYHPIPPDKAGYDTFEILRENLDIMLKDLLTENDIDDKDIGALLDENRFSVVQNHSFFKHYNNYDNSMDPIAKVKDFYKSCINEDLINRRAERPLLKLLKFFGGWPILETDWDESRFDWLLLVAQLRLYNNDVLISEWVGPDIKNSDEYVIQFDQTSLGLPAREYFLDKSNLKYLEAYRIYIITTANLLGASILSATEDADDIINFEIQLARITASQEDRRNVTEIYLKVTVGELQSIIPQIDWIRYLNLIMEVEIDPSQPVVCFSAPYFQDLVYILSNTSSRTIANYVLWRFVRHRVNNLDKRFQDAKQRFYYVLFGREKMPPRWQTCVTQINTNMGMALGKMFVEKYFDEHSKNDTLYMTKEIKQSFRDILSETTWLDHNTKYLARLKIDAMQLRIGYPEFILNLRELIERYSDVEINPNLYFENTISILKHLARSEQNRIFTMVNKTLWNTAPAIVNAYYSRNKNQIMFPAGILQPPFYHRYFPRCLNYGGIGVVIGHEMTHGFDDKGRLFDKEGNLQRWWRDQAIEEFHERAQCLIDQYNSYIVPEVNMQVDGINTQGENIADNGGIKQAYKAYLKWLDNNSDLDENLPGLNVTNKQLFFLNFAQIWCGAARPEATRNKLKTAVHSPGRFRVIGTLTNSKDFSEAYNCRSGSAMNPKIKCSVW